MNSEIRSPFVLNLRDAARQRLADISSHVLAPWRLSVALPASYSGKSKQQYPLLLLFDACDLYGSAVEMSRLMSQTREIRDCIVVGIELPVDSSTESVARYITETLLPWCRSNYRTAQEPAAVFSAQPDRATALVHACGETVLRRIGPQTNAADPATLVPALVRGLFDTYATGHEYGSEVTVMQNSLLMRVMSGLMPLFRHLRAKHATETQPNPHLLWSERLQRNFEIFTALPATAAAHPERRYPALVVLDANIEFSTVAEIAARLAAAGHTEEIAVIGIGVPRTEGVKEFGFRRFEEFSPPADGYDFNDPLGRIFRSLFAARGQDARLRIGQAPDFHAFIAQELLPLLQRQVPLDPERCDILGHSAGGTFVGYALAQADSPFRHYAGISPGIGISGSWLLRNKTPTATRAQRVYLCIGSAEQSNLFNQIAGIPDTSAYAEKLRADKRLQVQYRCLDGDTHSSVYAGAVTQALTFFYARPAGDAA